MLNACTSGLASGISTVATLSTFIGLPVSIQLVAISLAGAGLSGVATALTKKYQKRLSEVTKLVDIVTSATAVFLMSLSKALNNGKINKEEFNMLQTLYFKTMNELTGVNRKMGAENRNQFEKSLLEEINDIKKLIGTRPS